jgi:hypothetical protein
MLNLEVVRGPLPSDQDYQSIFAEYTRLTRAHVAERLMHRWCKDSPAGPALHALLRTDEGRIVGHACIIPFPIEVNGKRRTAGKVEYLFVHEDFRRQAVRGLEACRVHASILMLQQLYRHATEQLQWDPILVSAIPGVDNLHLLAGCRPMMLPLFECLLIRRPWNACRFTPNLSRAKRLALLLLGLPQTCAWAAARPLLLRRGRNLASLPMTVDLPSLADEEKARFSSDPDYLSWRYPEEGFQRLGFANRPNNYVITQKGSPRNYLRICQSNLDSLDFPVLSLIVGLMGQARSCHALGVRWAIYDNGRPPAAVVNKLKRLGFACVRRQRKVLIYTRRQELADPSCWSFDDSLVAFENHY